MYGAIQQASTLRDPHPLMLQTPVGNRPACSSMICWQYQLSWGRPQPYMGTINFRVILYGRGGQGLVRLWSRITTCYLIGFLSLSRFTFLYYLITFIFLQWRRKQNIAMWIVFLTWLALSSRFRTE